jgi:hypothetical protein
LGGECGCQARGSLVRERLGLPAPSEVLFAAGFGEGVTERSGAQPVADSVSVDADELGGSGFGGTGGQQGESALLGRG